MSDSVDVAIGVVEGKVIARWQQACTEISFDPKNAYQVSIALGKAALEAHGGKAADSKDAAFIDGELKQVKVTVTDAQRMMMVAKVATIIRSMMDQKATHGQIAVHAVDAVLRETAR